MKFVYKFYIFSIFTLAILNIQAGSPSQTRKFVILSDIHLNPFAGEKTGKNKFTSDDFSKLIVSSAEEWEGILSKIDYLSAYGEDSSYKLFQKALESASALKPDFVLYAGDFTRHNWDDGFKKQWKNLGCSNTNDIISKSLQAKLIKFMAIQFKKYFPNVPVYPVLGNNDSYCGDYELTPNGNFLKMFSKTWLRQNLFTKTFKPADFEKQFNVDGSYSVNLPILNHKLIALNTVFFSKEYKDCGALKPCSNNNPIHLTWLKEQLSALKSGEKAWILMHIPVGINGYSYNGNSAHEYLCPKFHTELLKILKENESVIQMVFAGHTHMDDFRILAEPTTSPNGLLTKLVPGISPLFDNNPSFQVFDYQADGTITNYQTYFLKEGETAFTPEYDFNKDYYGSSNKGLNAQTVKKLTEFKSFPSNYKKYFAGKSSYTQTDTHGKRTPFPFALGDKAYSCAITNANPTGYLNCVKPAQTKKGPNKRPFKIA